MSSVQPGKGQESPAIQWQVVLPEYSTNTDSSRMEGRHEAAFQGTAGAEEEGEREREGVSLASPYHREPLSSQTTLYFVLTLTVLCINVKCEKRNIRNEKKIKKETEK